jgi:mRNA interferase ChpB
MIDRGSIWLVDLEPTKGGEIRGARPVLVLSAPAFNARFAPLVAPITRGGGPARNAGFAVPLTGLGLQTDGVALAHQVRALDLAARGARHVETAPAALVDAVVERLALIVGENKE